MPTSQVERGGFKMEEKLVVVVIVSIGIVGIWIVARILSRRGGTVPGELMKTLQDLGAIKEVLEVMSRGLQAVKDDLNHRTAQQNQTIQEIIDMVSTGSRVQDQLHKHAEDTRAVVEGLKIELEARRRFEEINRESLKKIEGVLAGTKLKGIAGENILKEVLAVFPPEMVTSKLKIKGKEVEFGMVLADKTVLPIDVKWPSTDLLETLTEEEDPEVRSRAVEKIEKEVTRRVSEVAQYIEPGITYPWAICAIPDAIFSICKDAHIGAYKKHVILISYSMALPYLLTFFSLHYQYSGSIDTQNLKCYLIDLKRHLDQMLDILENKIEKSTTMLGNASAEYRQLIGSMKGSVQSIESSKEAVEKIPAIESPKR